MKIVIVGGVAGGASAAARLRRLCEESEIVLLEKGEYISYANCGLPYYIGGAIQDEDDLFVQTPESFHKRFCIDVRTRHEATGLDTVAKTVQVLNHQTGERYTESYDRLLLSPGARPLVPPVPGVELPGVFTLRTVPDTMAISGYIQEQGCKSALIVGGGYIGLEMAENLAARGLTVTIADQSPQLLSPLDPEMAQTVALYLTGEQGIRLLLGEALGCIHKKNGCLLAKVGDKDIEADMVLLAAGVRPDTGFVQSCGVELDGRGAILVNKHMQTSAPDVYAVGDAVAAPHFITGRHTTVALAGPANRQGRVAADNMAGIPTVYGGAQGSAIAKIFDLTVATTGLNESGAEAAGFVVDKVYITAASHASYYPGAHNLTLKLLFECKTGRILGAQGVGFDGVDKRCDTIATAIRAGLTAPELAELELCYAPPFSSSKDPVNVAGYVAENVLTGKVKQYFWQDLQRLPCDGSITFLDVRTKREVGRGTLPNAHWIPLDELRARLGELDRAKPVYVTCQSGLRSYLACRILALNGFDAYNFAGGYGLYEKLIQKPS